MNSNIFEEKKRKILKTFKEKNFEEVIAAGEKLLSEKKSSNFWNNWSRWILSCRTFIKKKIYCSWS